MRDRCARCYGNLSVIPIPPSVFTYVVYVTMAVAFVLLYMYTRNDDDLYLYIAIVFAVVMAGAQVVDLSRGEKYARAKIKMTQSDTKAMKDKGRKQH